MSGALDAVEGLRRTQAACVFLADYKLEAHWLRAWRSPGTTLFTRRIARGHTTKSGRRVDFALDVEEFISSGGFGPTMPRSPARWVWPRFPGCPVCDGGSVGVAGRGLSARPGPSCRRRTSWLFREWMGVNCWC